MIRTAGISDAIHAVMADGQRAVGSRIDVAKSTLGEWGTDISKWPAAKLLSLAATYPEVRAAVLDALAGTETRGRAGDAVRDGFGLMVTGNKALSDLATDLAHGTMTPADAHAIAPELRELLRGVHRLILDVDAIAACAGSVGARS